MIARHVTLCNLLATLCLKKSLHSVTAPLPINKSALDILTQYITLHSHSNYSDFECTLGCTEVGWPQTAMPPCRQSPTTKPFYKALVPYSCCSQHLISSQKNEAAFRRESIKLTLAKVTRAKLKNEDCLKEVKSISSTTPWKSSCRVLDVESLW